MSSLTQRINDRMAALGIRQKDVADRTGFSQGQVSHLCRGRTLAVEAATIFPLAKALECDPEWLATGEKE